MRLRSYNEFADYDESPNLCHWMALPAIAGWAASAGVSAGVISASTAATIGTVAQGVAIAGTVADAVMSTRSASKQASNEADAYTYMGQQNKAALERQGTELMAKNAVRTEAGGVASDSGSPLENELYNAFNLGKKKSLEDYNTRWDILRAKAQGQQAGQSAIGSAIGSFGSILGKGFQLSSNSMARGSMGTGWGPSTVRGP